MKIFSMQTRANANKPVNNYFMPIRQMNAPSVSQTISDPSISPPPKSKWGEPTWFLFHTLSVKIKDSEFAIIKDELLNTIYSICINLPCPTCANHAKMYLDGINFNTIQTKEDLKKMLFSFHNIVNKRKGYAIFPYEKLDEKYSLAITNNIIRNFMFHFSDKNRSAKLVAGDLLRIRLCEVLKQWFNKNIHSFDQ